MNEIEVVDSHTGGEPTRLVVAGGPDLGRGDMAARRAYFFDQHDDFRRAVVCEPRGWDAMVGALLCKPLSPECAAGVIFFNNVSYLGMCVHGMIGVIATLAHQQRIAPGEHRIETPVGEVRAILHDDGQVSVHNVASYRYAHKVCITVDGYGEVVGDVAWGGNWFFLVTSTNPSQVGELSLENVERLTQFTWAIRQALRRANVCGTDGAEIDHIELFGPPTSPAADSKNFVLCPGKAFDRSPCGTGTSAKAACLFADGKLLPGRLWCQESIAGSMFEASIEVHPDQPTMIVPTIKGSAFVMAESRLLLDTADPFCRGISAEGVRP